MTLLPVPLSDKHNGFGYVYLVKFELFKNCYKVGCTGNLRQRFSALEGMFGLSRYMVYGFTSEKFTHERIIQYALYEHSNRYISATRASNQEELDDIYDGGFIGGFRSREHFVIKESDLPNAIKLFDSLCISTCKPHRCGILS